MNWTSKRVSNPVTPGSVRVTELVHRVRTARALFGIYVLIGSTWNVEAFQVGRNI